MQGKWVLGIAAALLLVASGVWTAADARSGRGGGGGHSVSGGGFRGGGPSMSPRSYGGGSFSRRSFTGGNMAPRVQGGGTRAYRSGGTYRPGVAPRRHAGDHAGRRRHHRHRGRYVLYGAPFAYGLYDGYGYDNYGYDGSCEWLRQRALRTGRAYWWNRYEACLDRYGD